jgi:hypothetical protein
MKHALDIFVGGFVLMHHFPSGFLERPKSALHGHCRDAEPRQRLGFRHLIDDTPTDLQHLYKTYRDFQFPLASIHIVRRQ